MYAGSPLLWATKYATVRHPIDGAIPFSPYPYQVEFLTDRARRRIAVKARQVGMSATIAIEAVHKILYRPHRTVLFISRNQDLANELKGYADISLASFESKGGFRELGIKLVKDNTDGMVLSNNSRILSLASSKDAGRGIAASDVYLDEQAFHKYAEDIYQSVEGTISTGGSMTVISTPKGRNNLFSRIWHGQEGGAGWSKHRIHFSECPVYDEQWEKEKRDKMTIAAFAEEYGCDFTASGAPVFDIEDIEALSSLPLDPTANEDFVTAWDVGRRKDWAVGMTWALKAGIWHLIEFERLRVNYPTLQARIEDRVYRYPMSNHYVEVNGIGDPVIENLKVRVTPHLTTKASKDRAIENLKLMLQKRKLRARNAQFSIELQSYEYNDEDLVQDCVMTAGIAATHMYIDPEPLPEQPAGPPVTAGIWDKEF